MELVTTCREKSVPVQPCPWPDPTWTGLELTWGCMLIWDNEWSSSRNFVQSKTRMPYPETTSIGLPSVPYQWLNHVRYLKLYKKLSSVSIHQHGLPSNSCTLLQVTWIPTCMLHVYFHIYLVLFWSWDSSQCTDKVMGWTIHGSNLDRGKRIFLISKVSIPTVGYSQPPVQRVAGFFPRGKSSQGMNCTACTSAKAKNECRYSGARVHGEGQLYLTDLHIISWRSQ